MIKTLAGVQDSIRIFKQQSTDTHGADRPFPSGRWCGPFVVELHAGVCGVPKPVGVQN